MHAIFRQRYFVELILAHIPDWARAAVLILEMSDSADRIFAVAGAARSNMVMAMLLRRMGRNDLTVHGFRSTFHDSAGDATEFPRELIEQALAHTIKGQSGTRVSAWNRSRAAARVDAILGRLRVCLSGIGTGGKMTDKNDATWIKASIAYDMLSGFRQDPTLAATTLAAYLRDGKLAARAKAIWRSDERFSSSAWKTAPEDVEGGPIPVTHWRHEKI